MTLAIYKREREGILILALHGQLTLGDEDLAFRTTMESCINAGNLRIILDCRQLASIEAAGVDTLVSCQAELHQAGGKIVLTEVERTRMELPIMAKLEVEFDVFPDEQEAVNSFFPERALHRYDILQYIREQTGQ